MKALFKSLILSTQLILKLILVILLILLHPGPDLLAQKELFTVIASSGTVFYLSRNMAEWTDLTTGSKLFQGDKVKVEENGYVGLCYINGRTLELTQKGIFSVDDLALKLSAENASVTRKFTDYILNEILVKNKTKEMKNVAGVVRQSLTYIDKDFPTATVILDSVVTFKWYPVNGIKAYAFEIQNPSEESILLKETPDTSISVNIQELNLEPGNCYKWFVFDPDSQAITSDSSCIMVITKANYQSVKDTLDDLKQDLSDSESPLNQLIFATFFENNRMNLNALEHYEKAIDRLGQVEEYQKKYVLFLVRTGLYKRAQIMMEKWNFY